MRNEPTGEYPNNEPKEPPELTELGLALEGIESRLEALFTDQLIQDDLESIKADHNAILNSIREKETLLRYQYHRTAIPEIAQHFARLVAIYDVYKTSSVESMANAVTEIVDLSRGENALTCYHANTDAEKSESDINTAAEERLMADGLMNFLNHHQKNGVATFMVFTAFAACNFLPSPVARQQYLDTLCSSVSNKYFEPLFDLPWGKGDVTLSFYERICRQKFPSERLAHRCSPLMCGNFTDHPYSSYKAVTKDFGNCPDKLFLKIIVRAGNQETIQRAAKDITLALKRANTGEVKPPDNFDELLEVTGKMYLYLLEEGDIDLADRLMLLPLLDGKAGANEVIAQNQDKLLGRALTTITNIRVEYIQKYLSSEDHRQRIRQRYQEWLQEQWAQTVRTVDERNSHEYPTRVMEAFENSITQKNGWNDLRLTGEEMSAMDEEFVMQKKTMFRA